MSITVIYTRLKEWLDLGKVKRIGKRQQKTAQQKAWDLYEPVAGDA